MATVRVVVGPMPRLVEEILRDAARRRNDLEIVGVVNDWTGLSRSVAHGRPHAVILSEAECVGAVREVLLELYPDMRVLVLRGGGREGRAYRVETFGALSADEILDLACGTRAV